MRNYQWWLYHVGLAFYISKSTLPGFCKQLWILVIFCDTRSFDKIEAACKLEVGVKLGSGTLPLVIETAHKLLHKHNPANRSVNPGGDVSNRQETRGERERTQLARWINSYLCNDSSIRD